MICNDGVVMKKKNEICRRKLPKEIRNLHLYTRVYESYSFRFFSFRALCAVHIRQINFSHLTCQDDNAENCDL